MRKFLFFLPFIFIGCVSQKVTYKTTDLVAPVSAKTIPIMCNIKLLADSRFKDDSTKLLVENANNRITHKGKLICINAEKFYKKDSVPAQYSRMMVEHFNKLKLFKLAIYNNDQFCNYYLSGTLRCFFGEQEFSTAALVGTQFGLIGALATAGVKTQSNIRIELSDLKLCKKNGDLVKDLGGFAKTYSEKLHADGYCWCIYWNINEKLKEFNTELVEKLRHDLENISFE